MQQDGALRVLCGSSKGYAFSGTDGEVALITVNIGKDMASGDYPLVLKTVKLSDTNAQKVEVARVESTLTIGGSNYLRGDVNGDGKVTIADVTELVNIILGKE